MDEVIETSYGMLFIMFNSAFFFTFGLAIYFHNRKSFVNIFFAIYLLLAALFMLFSFAYMGLSLYPHVLMPIQMAFTSLMPPVFLWFAMSFSSKFQPKRKHLLLFLPAVYIIIINLLRILHPDIRQQFQNTISIQNFTIIRETDIHYIIYSAYHLLAHIAGSIALLRISLKETDRQKRKQVRLVTMAILMGFAAIFIFTNIPQIFNIKFAAEYRSLVQAIIIFLCILATGITIMYHKAWTVEYLLQALHNREAELYERNKIIENELDMARLIQYRLLPSNIPPIRGIKLQTLYHPMDKVGGDYYDIRISDENIDLFIADVSGHGIPGAFLASITKMAFQYNIERIDHGSELLYSIDETLNKLTVRSLFVTAAFLRLHRDTLLIDYANAGHQDILIHRRNNGEILELNSRGGPMGIGLGNGFEDRQYPLQSADRLILYTDGITEVSCNGEEWGEDRFKQFLVANSDTDIDEFCQRLMETLKKFSGQTSFADDLTLIVVDL